MNSNWVGAGHLKIGDKIKQADGTTGVVANVTTIQQTQEMFNLTVDEAHTFYVGTQGWLVHNGVWECLGWKPRAINPAHPPNAGAANTLANMPMAGCDRIGCDVLAQKLLQSAGGEGTTISIVSSAINPTKLKLPLEGEVTGGWAWHQAYTDGRYVFDPFVSNVPIPKGDYIKMMQQLNPGSMIKYGLDTKLGGPSVEDFIPNSFRW